MTEIITGAQKVLYEETMKSLEHFGLEKGPGKCISTKECHRQDNGAASIYLFS